MLFLGKSLPWICNALGIGSGLYVMTDFCIYRVKMGLEKKFIIVLVVMVFFIFKSALFL